MKVTGLILATLSLVAFAQGKHDYRLRCAQEEMGIRWPSYVSHSEYYVCPRVNGKQMTVTCNPGEVFTFVLQMCTGPSQYIPAPAFETLPTASPLLATNVAHPPIIIETRPPVFDIPSMRPQPPQQPPSFVIEAPKAPVQLVEDHKHEGEHHAGHHGEHHGEHHTVEEIVKDDKPSKPMVLPPMPPTPAPTPPVVDPVLAESSKKPQGGLNKKPASDKNKTSAGKPSKTGKGKPTAEKAAKKSAKNPKRPAPAKKSPPKKAPAKKSPAKKAPAQA